MKNLALLAAAALTFWAVLIYPSWLLWGDSVWLQSLAALAACVLPALATLFWTEVAGTAPEQQVVAILGGSGLRLVVALGTGLALTKIAPDAFGESFWGWLAVFYLFILVVETYLVLKQKRLVAK